MKKTPKRIKSESQFLLIMATLVILMSVPTVLSFLKAPEAEALEVQKLDSRAPASIGTVVTSVKKTNPSSSSMSLLNFDCKKKDFKEEVSANYVRLVGSPCKDAEDLEIINTSNGFSASVIFTKGHNFTTDFIDLKEGENNLEITETDAKGIKVSHNFKVTRRTPTSISQ